MVHFRHSCTCEGPVAELVGILVSVRSAGCVNYRCLADRSNLYGASRNSKLHCAKGSQVVTKIQGGPKRAVLISKDSWLPLLQFCIELTNRSFVCLQASGGGFCRSSAQISFLLDDLVPPAGLAAPAFSRRAPLRARGSCSCETKADKSQYYEEGSGYDHPMRISHRGEHLSVVLRNGGAMFCTART